MKFTKKLAFITGSLAIASAAWAGDAPKTDSAKEVREIRGLVENGFASHLGDSLVAKVGLTEAQLATLELGLADIQSAMPAMGTVDTDGMIEAHVAAHLAVKALIDSILTDEQKAILSERKGHSSDRAKGEKAERPEKADKPEKAERPEKADKPEKAERPEKADKPAKKEKKDKVKDADETDTPA